MDVDFRKMLCEMVSSGHWLYDFLDCKRYELPPDPPDDPPEPPPDIPPDPPVIPDDPEDPSPDWTETKWPVPSIGFMTAHVPYDLWGHLLPFRGPRFNWKRWRETWELEAMHDVNSTRGFFTGTEDAWSFEHCLMPFKRRAKYSVNLRKFGDEIEEIDKRWEEVWKRKISTVLSMGYLSRWAWSVWHGSHNVNGTTRGSRIDFLRDRKTRNVFKDVLAMAWDRYKDNPYVILETGNELPSEPKALLMNWEYEMIEFLINEGCPPQRIGFNYHNTSKIYPILDDFDPWCFVHGVNNYAYIKRFTKGEMKKIIDEYSRICWDTDGWQTWQAPRFIGNGMKGRGWFAGFQRPSSEDMEEGLVLSKKKGVAGWIIMSGAFLVDSTNGTKPDFFRGKEIALEGGLTRAECDWYQKVYREQYAESRRKNPNLPDYQPVIPYHLNKKPEFKAIKSAVNRMKWK